MAKLKKTVRAKAAGSKKNDDLQAKAEHMSRSLVESAQQIWMAGVGAFNRAQGEGSKMFEALVAEGMTIEKTTRKLATGKVDAVRDVVEERVGVVRERATDTWDRLEKVFEERVQRALNRLGVPGREELADLIGRVDAPTGPPKQSGPRATQGGPESPRPPGRPGGPSRPGAPRRRPPRPPRRPPRPPRPRPSARRCRRPSSRSPRRPEHPDSGTRCARQPVTNVVRSLPLRLPAGGPF